MKGKQNVLMVAILLTILFCAIVTPVSATTRYYAEKQVLVQDTRYPIYSIDRYHIGLVYPLSLAAANNANIGGVNQYDLNRYSPTHTNIQGWDRKYYSAGHSMVLTPRGYCLHHLSYFKEIYLEVQSGQV